MMLRENTIYLLENIYPPENSLVPELNQFNFRMRCILPFQIWRETCAVTVAHPDLVVPEGMTPRFLKGSAERLKFYSERDGSLFNYAQSQLDIIKCFCVIHKYNITEILGPEYAEKKVIQPHRQYVKEFRDRIDESQVCIRKRTMENMTKRSEKSCQKSILTPIDLSKASKPRGRSAKQPRRYTDAEFDIKFEKISNNS